MKKADVKLGGVYAAKVSDRIVPVRLEAIRLAGGWYATNLKSGRRIDVKTAARLRYELERAPYAPVDDPDDLVLSHRDRWVRKGANRAQ